MPKKLKLKPSLPGAKLTWLPKKTFELEFSIPWPEVKTAYTQVVDQLTKESKLEGFRKGKAPKALIEKSVDKGKLYEEVINRLLPLSYAKSISQHQLKPAVAPKIQIISAKENEAWQFKATSCELPQVSLGNYTQTVKGVLAKEKIWTPAKGAPDKKEQKDLTETQKLNLIAKSLIDSIRLDLSDLLVESERDRLLAKLLDQIQKLGLSIDQYAISNNKTVDQIKAEYLQTASNSLKLEIILQAIADDKGFKVTDAEIDKMIAAAGDEKIKKALNTPGERAYIASVLRKRQVIDYLLGL